MGLQKDIDNIININIQNQVRFKIKQEHKVKDMHQQQMISINNIDYVLGNQDDNNYFCYLIMKVKSEAFIGIALTTAALFILFKALRQYIKASKLPSFSFNVKIIYYTIFIWSMVYIGKIIFAQIVFWSFEDQNQTSDKHSLYHLYSIASKRLFVVDITGVFLLQAVLILVCYNWSDNMIKQLTLLGGMNNQSVTYSSEPNSPQKPEINLKSTIVLQKNQFRKQQISRNLLRFYIGARAILYLFIIPFIAEDRQSVESIIVKIMLVLLIVEAFLVIVVIVIAIILIRRNKLLKQLVQQHEINLIVNQYILLLICSVIRLILDIIFDQQNFEQLNNSSKCIRQDLIGAGKVTHIINFTLEAVFTHFMPLLVVLRIYNIQDSQETMKSSLLAAETHFSSIEDDVKADK